LLLDEPPSLDRGELTDKGTLNQRAVLTHRAALVEALYSDTCDAAIAAGLLATASQQPITQ
jgi:feruloyl-CoA synthase